MTINEEMLVYKNNPVKKPVINNLGNFETGNSYESEIKLGVHTGTHIDAPLHMIEGGSKMDCYSIERFVTQAKVLDMTHIKACITKEDLVGKGIKKGDFILFKTQNSFDTSFNFDFVFLERSGASYLQEIGIIGAGTDGLGIERSQPDHMTHKTLLSNNIMIVEGLALKDVNEGNYQLIILPIKLLETEAAPARAILIQED
jgi:arylformamidase